MSVGHLGMSESKKMLKRKWWKYIKKKSQLEEALTGQICINFSIKIKRIVINYNLMDGHMDGWSDRETASSQYSAK